MTSSASCFWERLRIDSNSLNKIHLSQGVSIQLTSCISNKILDDSLSFQVFNNLGMNQKICNYSSKRNNITLLCSESISGVPYNTPHVVENYIDNVNLLLSGNAVQNVLLLFVDEIWRMSCFSVIKAP